MNDENIIEITLNKFPILIPLYEEDKYYLEGLSHLFFENIFLPYLIQVVEKNSNTSLINDIFDFLEEMVLCKDIYVQEVVFVSILEPLYCEKMRNIENFTQYFRINTFIEFKNHLKIS